MENPIAGYAVFMLGTMGWEGRPIDSSDIVDLAALAILDFGEIVIHIDPKSNGFGFSKSPTFWSVTLNEIERCGDHSNLSEQVRSRGEEVAQKTFERARCIVRKLKATSNHGGPLGGVGNRRFVS
jgi:hypothetical protein